MPEKLPDKKPEVAITSKNVKNKVVQKMAFLSLLKEVKSIKGKSCHWKTCKMENCVEEKHEWKTRNGKTGSGKPFLPFVSSKIKALFSRRVSLVLVTLAV